MNKRGKRSGFSFPVVGGTSLLVMFAVLCLITFAVLSLSTVKAGDRLGEASAEAVMEYYAADYEAERILAQLRSGILPEGVVVEGDVYGYSCPVSETQRLQVSVQKVGEDWKVLRWMVVTEWN
ncbi:MAG: hypothetical protein IIX88_03945 [Firmicutes bacterium]|nr:hypothetical protein [Bacillota bacterium]MBR6501380.1 hypothetical protein [Bacillota bacterium]